MYIKPNLSQTVSHTVNCPKGIMHQFSPGIVILKVLQTFKQLSLSSKNKIISVSVRGQITYQNVAGP